MHDENITPGQEIADPLAGWKSGASFILALLTVLGIGRIF